MNRNHSIIGIMNLPDEMIFTIWNKLSNIDVLYSFIGVNERFDGLVRDRLYVRSIHLTNTDQCCSLSDPILNRYCLDILPQISQYIEYLILEPLSMERILLSGNYPRLRQLTLRKLSEDFLLRHFNDKSSLMNSFKNNLTHLVLTIDRKEKISSSCADLGKNFLTNIFHTFSNLIDLNFDKNKIDSRQIISIYGLSPITCYSSSLVSLSVTVRLFDDCLCLFDGRFPQLRKLNVVIACIDTPVLIIENLSTLSHMKSFSLTSYSYILIYDNHILPLIRQMICLEELILHLVIEERSTFIDGAHLKNELFIYLSKLQIFKFDITTYTKSMNNQMYNQSNDDIYRTFLNWKYGPVNCYISHYPKNDACCHIFSVPLNMNNLCMISYGFQGTQYTTVRYLYLSDGIYPFKHEFFLRIARAFPFITDLTVLNNRIPENIDENNNQIVTIVEFSHLTCLRIHFQRAVYVEQFLVDTKTHLPKLIDLTISYRNLVTVTENFTRSVTRRNCSKVQYLRFTIPADVIQSHPQNFYLHFPCLKKVM